MSARDNGLQRLTETCAQLKAGLALSPALATWVAEQLTRDYWLGKAGHDLDALYAQSVVQTAQRALIMRRVQQLASAAGLPDDALSGLASALSEPGLRKHAIIKLATDALQAHEISQTSALHLVARWLDTTRDAIAPLYKHQPKRTRTTRDTATLDPDGVLLGPLGQLALAGGKKIF